MRIPTTTLAKKIRPSSGHIAEFPLTLYILFFIVVFPCIDLVGLATGLTTICLLAHESASRAANQRKYSDSLNGMEQTTMTFLTQGFAKFAKLKPVGGYVGMGTDLYVDAINFRNNKRMPFGPNTAVTPPVDVSNCVYECRVVAHYEVGPVLDLSFVPLLGMVPGIGKPVLFNFSASRAAEYPMGLEAYMPPGPNENIAQFNTVPSRNTAGALAGPDDSGWNIPNLYERIAQAGQTAINSNVVVVEANNASWTPTGIFIASGQKLWIDLRADGMWTTSPTTPPYNANGGNFLTSPGSPLPGASIGKLIGRVGAGLPFAVGTSYQNYAPGQVGQLYFLCNDNVPGWIENSGAQTVRVVLAQ
jgi:hypothetical protein